MSLYSSGSIYFLVPNLHTRTPNPPDSLAPDPLDYELPESAIARDPAPNRDESRLLVARDGGETIEHHHFYDLPSLLPPGALLVRNVSRVVRARIPMARTSGGRIELFLLEPVAPSHDPAVAIATTGSTTWRCMVGGARKFRREPTLTLRLENPHLLITATLESIDDEGAVVKFSWKPEDVAFAEVLERVGEIPLPPYLDRESREEDVERYQTVFATTSGAVAAPTAGLHFTPRLLDKIESSGVEIADLVLHVGAGTFKPISGSVAEHTMHRERFSVERSTLGKILAGCERHEREGVNAPIIPVGTTSVRVLESLYWLGVRLLETGQIAGNDGDVEVEQWEPYSRLSIAHALPTPVEAVRALCEHLDHNSSPRLDGVTGIMIVPGYRFALCDALITNFHQPHSTLLLLIAALVGEQWKQIYREALAHGYRFLSYGDSSMLWREARSEK